MFEFWNLVYGKEFQNWLKISTSCLLCGKCVSWYLLAFLCWHNYIDGKIYIDNIMAIYFAITSWLFLTLKILIIYRYIVLRAISCPLRPWLSIICPSGLAWFHWIVIAIKSIYVSLFTMSYHLQRHDVRHHATTVNMR